MADTPKSLPCPSWTGSLPLWRLTPAWQSRGLYVGCGNGRNFLPLVDSGLELHGLDVSGESLRQLQAPPSRVTHKPDPCRLPGLPQSAPIRLPDRDPGLPARHLRRCSCVFRQGKVLAPPWRAVLSPRERRFDPSSPASHCHRGERTGRRDDSLRVRSQGGTANPLLFTGRVARTDTGRFRCRGGTS